MQCKGFTYCSSLFFAYARNLCKSFGLLFHYSQGVLAEFMYYGRRCFFAYAFERSCCKKFLYALYAFGNNLFIFRKGKLLPVCRVHRKFAAQNKAQSLAAGRYASHCRKLFLLCFKNGYGIAVFFVMKYYICDYSLFFLHCINPVSSTVRSVCKVFCCRVSRYAPKTLPAPLPRGRLPYQTFWHLSCQGSGVSPPPET